MVRKLLYIVFIITGTIAGAQTYELPDTAFAQCLNAREYPVDGQTLYTEQAKEVYSDITCIGENISSLDGLQFFENISYIHISNHEHITEIPNLDRLNLVRYIWFIGNNADYFPEINHLSGLEIFNLKDNNLSEEAIPDLTGLHHLEEVNLSINNLNTAPELTSLERLKRLYLDRNNLTAFPDISQNTNLRIIDVFDNQLTALPDLSDFQELNQLKIHGNNLTFEDILPITTSAELEFAEGNLTYFNQAMQKLETPQDSVLTGTPITLSIPIDDTVSTNVYEWFHEGSLVETTNKNSLTIEHTEKADEGDYHVEVTNPSAPQLTIYSDTVSVNIFACEDTNYPDLDYQTNRESCSGLEIEVLHEHKGPALQYHLINTFSGDTSSSYSHYFNNTGSGRYALIAEDEYGCTTDTLSLTVDLSEWCEDASFTPNGDGHQDTYYFDKSGKITIYNRSGRIIKTLQGPVSWDGRGKNGQLVPVGYYIVIYEDGSQGELSVLE